MTTAKQVASHWGWRFFPIWTGQALSWLGSTVAQFALVWWLTDHTGSATVLATASTAALVPQILLGPLAGTYVDRWNRRLVMIVADGFMALLALWLAWLFWQDRLAIWHVYVLMVGRALGGIFHQPAMMASTTMLVPKKELPRIQGLNQALGGAVNVVGPPLGALALSLLPFHQVMLLDVITALIAVLPLFWVTIPEPARRVMAGQVTSVWDEMLAGFRYLYTFPGMMALIVVAIGMNFIGAPVWTLLPLYVRNVFDGDAAGLSMVQSAFGIGLIAGGLLLSIWRGFSSRVVTAFGSFVITGVMILLVGGMPAGALWGMAMAWFVFAFFNAIGNGLFIALMQGVVAPEMQGRVLSAISSGVSLATPLGLLLSAPVVEAFGLRSWYLTAGIVTTAMSLFALFSPAVRRLDDIERHLVERAPSEDELKAIGAHEMADG